jgi:lipopolysaccharide/colanic/teichoic acid biosynthesis glycosyltransferase
MNGNGKEWSGLARGVPAWKRGLDIGLVLLSSPIVVPLGLLIGLVIKVISPGPVLFRQERVGYLGKRFMCLKFRTMAVNADTGVHEGHLTHLMKSDRPMVKLDSNDSRLIRGGRLLRASGLDELPQVINVLRGEMSLVGPRPCLPYEYEKYRGDDRSRCALRTAKDFVDGSENNRAHGPVDRGANLGSENGTEDFRAACSRGGSLGRGFAFSAQLTKNQFSRAGSEPGVGRKELYGKTN